MQNNLFITEDNWRNDYPDEFDGEDNGDDGYGFDNDNEEIEDDIYGLDSLRIRDNGSSDDEGNKEMKNFVKPLN